MTQNSLLRVAMIIIDNIKFVIHNYYISVSFSEGLGFLAKKVVIKDSF